MPYSQTNKPIILSLGGSLIVPENGRIDTDFLEKFNTFIRRHVEMGRRFFIVCGGGSTTRLYQQAARTVLHHQIPNDDLDWIGIHATRLNAHLVRTIFRDIAYHRVLKHLEIILKVDKPVAVAAGWKPGWSTDYCAVMLCQDYHLNTVINLTNIEKVYTADPKKDPTAKPVDHIKIDDYLKIVGKKWVPGMNAPFDPIAAQLAQKLGVTIKILKGQNFENLEKAVEGKEFTGTIIE